MKKKCIKCGVEKPNTLEFFRKSHGDKLRNGCRECEKKYKREYQQENKKTLKEKSKEYNKKYYEQNREKLLEKSKRWVKENKGHVDSYKKQWYEDNKEEHNRKRRERWRELNPKEEIPEGMKKCCNCNEIKPKTVEYFNNCKSCKDGFKHACKECRKVEYENNKDKYLKQRKLYYKKNKAKVLKMIKLYKEENSEWYQEYRKKYYEENSDKIKETSKKNIYKRAQNDIGFRLLMRCRTRIYNALKGRTKSKRTRDLIGCTVDHLMQHLENQFQEGMTWENYGEWHVDHIKPCAMFDFTDEAQQRECFHFTNLQPLWAEENMRKSAKYEEVSE